MEIVEFGEILIFVDADFVVAVRHGEASRLIEARHKLEADPGRLACGPGSVLHAILHQVVRDYAVVLDELGADIRGIEDDVFSSEGDSERIYRLKQEVLSFHEAAEPLEEPLYLLATEEFKAIDSSLKPYFRDVLDHLLRVLDRINVYRDTLTSVLAANLTQVSLRQNEDMRKISCLRRHRRHSHVAGRDLGDELRAHARDQRGVGLPGGTADNGRGLPLSVHPFQEERLALR